MMDSSWHLAFCCEAGRSRGRRRHGFSATGYSTSLATLAAERGNPLEISGLTTAVPAESEALLADVRWEPGALVVELGASADRPVSVQAFGPAADVPPPSAASQPLVELIITGDGRARTTTRFTNSGVGTRLRYREHHAFSDGEQNVLEVVQADPLTGLVVTTRLTASNDVSAARVVTEVTNQGQVPVVLEAVTSFAFGAVIAPGERTTDLQLHSGTGEQLAENRWTTRPLWSQSSIVDFNSLIHNQPGRGSFEAVGISTWSTARVLPTAALSNAVTGRAFAWQIEHNGGWRLGGRQRPGGRGLHRRADAGPDRHRPPLVAKALAPGRAFTSVPVSVAVSGDGFEGAVAALTHHRRWLRRRRRADRASAACLQRLHEHPERRPDHRAPAAADRRRRRSRRRVLLHRRRLVRRQTGDWWPTVGDWTPSTPPIPRRWTRRVVDRHPRRGHAGRVVARARSGWRGQPDRRRTARRGVPAAPRAAGCRAPTLLSRSAPPGGPSPPRCHVRSAGRRVRRRLLQARLQRHTRRRDRLGRVQRRRRPARPQPGLP